MMDDVRVNRADRRQPAFEMVDLERLVPLDHRVRDVWAFVETLDLSLFYARIKARGETAGRPAVDPRILLALWLYATIEGIGSARALDRLCEHHLIYRWICGGVGVNHELLRTFRNESGGFLDQLLTRGLTALIAEGLIRLDEMITDGTKVRASASRSSMRHKPRVAELETELKARIARLREELEADPAATERRLKVRRLAAAEERIRRVRAAHEKFAEREAAQSARAKQRPGEAASQTEADAPRVSTTDPDARLMKMADGATRPCYNVQVGTANEFVVAIQPTERGNDRGLAPAVVAEAERRCGRAPARLLADSTAMTEDDIIGFAASHPVMEVYAPPKGCSETAKPASRARYERERARDPQCLKDWRMRMDSEPGKTVYARRSNTEHPHARMKNCGFGRMLVRGLEKVRTVCLLHAVAHNFILAAARRAALARCVPA
jgi:transposase